MEYNSIVSKEKLLDIIYEKIISNLDSTKDNGLLEGRMGIVLFLYDYAKKKNSEKIEEEAGNIIDDIWESLHLKESSFSFYKGHSGIAWSLFWLNKQGFLDMASALDQYIKLVDSNIFNALRIRIPIQIDLESNLFSSGIYLLSRCNFSDKNLLEIYYLQEVTIYLVEECERILYRKTSCNNIYLPDFTLSLLNSILYFLISVHKRKIYPYKTKLLIEYTYLSLMELIGQSNIQDAITSKCLLLTINNDISFCNKFNINQVNACIKKSEEQIGNILGILSESGFYCLLYNNRYIFEETYSYINQYNFEYINFLYDEFSENGKIPIKKLLGIGYGLLAMLNKQ